jgi:transcription elongation factor GreA
MVEKPAMEKHPMTPGGHAKLREELLHLRSVERPAISKAIGVARDHGDLSENAEYHAAKERQGMIEARIKDIEAKLALAEVIDPAKVTGSRVAFGAKVKLSNQQTDEEVTYQIIGAEEAKLEDGTLSISSPLARALLGKEVGDEVKIRMPGGERMYEILDVSFG